MCSVFHFNVVCTTHGLQLFSNHVYEGNTKCFLSVSNGTGLVLKNRFKEHESITVCRIHHVCSSHYYAHFITFQRFVIRDHKVCVMTLTWGHLRKVKITCSKIIYFLKLWRFHKASLSSFRGYLLYAYTNLFSQNHYSFLFVGKIAQFWTSNH